MRLLLSVCFFCAWPAYSQPQADLDQALLDAARKGDAAQVKELLAKGANVEAKTRHGVTPLFYAASHGNVEVMKILIGKGADVNVHDSFYKASALGFTVDNDHMAAAKLLIESGCKDAESVLPDVAGKGDVELVKLILARGPVKPAVLTSALTQAEEKKQATVVEILKQAGAQPPKKPDFAVDPKVLATYAGRYRDERMGDWVFAVKEGKLFVDVGGENYELGAFDPVTFGALKIPGVQLKFEVENGKATRVAFTGEGGQTTPFKRVEGQ
jgi:hypothetical protein